MAMDALCSIQFVYEQKKEAHTFSNGLIKRNIYIFANWYRGLHVRCCCECVYLNLVGMSESTCVIVSVFGSEQSILSKQQPKNHAERASDAFLQTNT